MSTNLLTPEQRKFLIRQIKSHKTKRECVTALENKFNRSFRINSLEELARKNKLKFLAVQPDAWPKEQEQILKGLLLVNANWARRVQELPTRGVKSMTKKIAKLKLSGAVSDSVKKQIEKEVKDGVSLKEIAKTHDINIKFVNEFAQKVNRTTIEFENLKRWESKEIDELFDIIQIKTEKLRQMDSEQQNADIKVSTKAKYVALTVLSDFHLENINTDLAQLRNDFKIIKDTPNFFAGFNGDLIDNFAAGPHKEGANESSLPAREARMLAGKLFESLKDKMLWMVLGCHDAWDKDNADYDLPQHIARKIMVPYLGAGGDINLKINDVEYLIHSRHKYRGSSGIVNGTGCCKKILTEIDPKFDIVAVSHNHFSEIKSEHYLGKQRCYIRTGSYKREDRYSKRIGFRGNEYNVQIPVVILNTEKKEMKIVSGISNAADMLKALNKTK